MTPEKQKKLYDKYPKLFAQKDMPMSQTCMFWGIECGDGWESLIDFVCEKLSEYDETKKLGIQFVQIKEKFGGLRIYTNISDEFIEAILDVAEDVSLMTCEDCGRKGKTYDFNGWYRTVCKQCKEKYDNDTIN